MIRSSGTSLNPPLDLPARVVEWNLTRTLCRADRNPTLYSTPSTEGGSTPVCEEEIQRIIWIAVSVGADGAHQNQRRETGAANENTTATERTKTTVRPAQLDPLPRDGT